ncbi:MAG: glycosyltransferase [bacterium]|nr:glycosyltransferase [bacterium]
MQKPLISVIIPVRNLSDFLINENLPAMSKQSYKNFEVIVLPNEKNEMDKDLLSKYSWLKIIPTHKITRPALKRDRGVEFAKGNIIAFIDDDAYPSRDWIKNALQIFDNKKVIAVCGPGLLPTQTNTWEKIFDEVLISKIGSGNYTYRFVKGKPQFVDDYPSMNFFIQKNIFTKLGGFDNNYWPGEDSKLCEDIVYKEKGKIFYDPNVTVFHHRRTELKGFLKQHANYGFHRGAFFAHGDNNSRRLVYFIPTLFIIYLIFSLSSIFVFYLTDILLPQFLLLISLPLFLYILLMLSLLLNSFKNTKNIFISILTPVVLFLTHLVYGTMFIKGILKGILNKEKIYE